MASKYAATAYDISDRKNHWTLKYSVARAAYEHFAAEAKILSAQYPIPPGVDPYAYDPVVDDGIDEDAEQDDDFDD